MAFSYTLQQAYALEVAAESHTASSTEIKKVATEDVKRDQQANWTVGVPKGETLEIKQNSTKADKANSSNATEAAK